MNSDKTERKNSILFLICVFIIPFLRGLFFKEVFLPVTAFLIIVFIFVLLKNDKIIFDKNIMLLFLFQYALVIIGAFTGINRGESIYGLFIYIMPVYVYLLFTNIRFERLTGKFLASVFLSGAVIAIINILIESVSNESGKTIRFAWIIPYANTLAVFLFSCSAAGIYILFRSYSDSRYSTAASIFITRMLTQAALSIIISAFILTFSRIMWVIAPFAYFIYILLLGKRRLLMDFAIILMVSLAAIYTAVTSQWKLYWLMFVVPILFFSLYGLITGLMIKKVRLSSSAKPLIYAALTIVILGLMAYSSYNIIFNSTELYERILSINLNTLEIKERFAYYRDAANILKDYPIAGTGRGGWASIKYKYQTAVYFTEYAHSSVIQTAVDYGFTGLLVFGLQILLPLIYIILSVKGTGYKAISVASAVRAIKPEVLCILTINLVLLIHSFLDIDFEFPLMNMLFWANSALLIRIAGVNNKEKDTSAKIKAVVIISSLLIVLSMIPIYASDSYYRKAEKLYAAGNYREAEMNYFKAAKYDISSESYYNAGKALMEQYFMEQKGSYPEKILDYYTRAQMYDKFNPVYTASKASFLYSLGNYDESIREYRDLLLLQPLKIEFYEEYSNSLIAGGEKHLAEGEKEKSRRLFLETTAIEGRIMNVKNKLSENAYKLKHKPALTLTAIIAYNIGKAFYYLSDPEKGDIYFKIASTEQNYTIRIDEFKRLFSKAK